MFSFIWSSEHYLSAWPLLASGETNDRIPDLEDVTARNRVRFLRIQNPVQTGIFQRGDRQRIQFMPFIA